MIGGYALKTLGYIEKTSFVHSLTGATKLIILLLCSFVAMLSYDTRVLVVLLILSFIVFAISKIQFREISFIVYFILVFLVINNIAIYIFAPYQGVEIYGTKTVLFDIAGNYSVTAEQLFYHLNITLKYFAVTPFALLFIVATQPSEFAASLNKIGVNYKIAYAVSITLRYIPDIQNSYQEITFAQQARGVDLSKKAKLRTKVKHISTILVPLVFSSLERIETISAAMELRAFGNNTQRTWYSEKPFTVADYLSLIFMVIFFAISMYVTFSNGSRFYNPFIG